MGAVARPGKRGKRRLRRRRAPRWLLPLVVFGVMAFLYARPISSYLETRDQLAERQAEVAALRAERARVTARLARATSLDELARAARRIGYVRPGEHLFIVKGTTAWKRRHADDLASSSQGG
jgi:cell division protein FtsB